MIIFLLILFCILLLLCFFEIKGVNKGLFPIVAIVFVIVGILTSLNYDLADKKNYIEIFDMLPRGYSIFNIDNYNGIHGEIGFLLFCSFFLSFIPSYNLLFLSIFYFSSFLNLSLIKKYCEYPLLMSLLYFSHAMINKEMMQIRAGIISALALYLIVLLFRNEIFKSFLLIIVGSLFHSSLLVSIIPSAIWFIFKNNVNKLRVFLILTLLISLSISILVNIDQIFGYLSIVIPIPESVMNYLSWNRFNYSLGLMNPIVLKQLFITIVCIIYLYRYEYKNKLFIISIVFYCFSTSWIIFFNDFAILGARIASVFSVAEFILIPLIIKNSKSKGLVYFMFLLIIIINFYFNLSKDTLSLFYTEVF